MSRKYRERRKLMRPTQAQNVQVRKLWRELEPGKGTIWYQLLLDINCFESGQRQGLARMQRMKIRSLAMKLSN